MGQSSVRVSALVVPPVDVKAVPVVKIDKWLQDNMCGLMRKKACCFGLSCTRCLYYVFNLETFLKTAHKYWRKDDE